jgi:hypothetical protein
VAHRYPPDECGSTGGSTEATGEFLANAKTFAERVVLLKKEKPFGEHKGHLLYFGFCSLPACRQVWRRTARP